MPPLKFNQLACGVVFLCFITYFQSCNFLVAEYSIGLCEHHLLTRYKVTNVTTTVSDFTV